jgi:sec-independent protein translocase protein TatA
VEAIMFGFIPGLGMQEILLLLLLGVLLFGRKLPELGRSVGKTLVEFKRGYHGLEEEITNSASSNAKPAIEPEPVKPPQRVTPSASAPKFDDAPVSNLPPKV